MGGMGYFLSLFQRYVVSRAGSTAIGIFVAISLIWFAGPRLGLRSIELRLALMGAVVLVALLVWLVRRYVARRRGTDLKAGIDGQLDPKAAARSIEIEALRAQMSEAIASLKSSELGAGYRGSAALYALPWYMIIGPSAAGKSTLLRNSGLHFPYSNQDDIHVKGYGGTRNCDWWFSDQAVFLDTAGRYTTEEDDHEEWVAFLDLLRKHRRRMPINGVIVCVSLSELLTADGDGLEWHVKIIRNRINELIRQLRLVFPVYVVLTKCDLLQGFDAFFEDLSEHERNQVWGAYLFEVEKENVAPADRFETAMGSLYAKLCELRLPKMSMQRNVTRKGELFDFPNQFMAATAKLCEFIGLLLKDNPYQEMPRFAGVHFTSATQEGTPIERILGDIRQTFGQAEVTAETSRADQRSYFVRNLFTDVIFQIQAGVNVTRGKVLWGRGLKSAAVIGGIGVIALTYLGLSGAYAHNAYLLGEGRDAASQARGALAGQGLDMDAAHRAVAGVYDHSRKLQGLDGALPWYQRVGLYRADVQVEPLQGVLRDSLGLAFWGPTLRAVEGKLSDSLQRWNAADKAAQEQLREEYYETLRAYLMLTRPAHLDVDEAVGFCAATWKTLLSPTPAAGADEPGREDERRERMVRFYLSLLASGDVAAWPERAELVSGVRDQLRTVPSAKQLYARLRSKGKAVLKPVVLRDLVAGSGGGLLVSNKVVAGIYTAKGWREFFRPELRQLAQELSEGDWVLDSISASDVPIQAAESTRTANPELAAALERDTRALYFRDYPGAWFDLLASVGYRPFGSVSGAAAALAKLSSSAGPLAELATSVAANMTLTDSTPAVVDAAVAQASAAAGDAANAVAGTAAPIVPEPAAPKQIAALEGPLRDLRRFSTAVADQAVSAELDDYLRALTALHGDVERMASSADVQRGAAGVAAGILSGSGTGSGLYQTSVTGKRLLNGFDASTRKALRPLLTRPLQMTWSLMMGEATGNLEREWQSAVVRPYDQKLRGRYPFTDGGQDATLEDVAEFFRPDNGILWSFVEEHLSPYLVDSPDGWQARSWQGLGPRFSSEFLSSLTEAKRVADSLFESRGNQIGMTFHVYPEPVQGLREMLVESNGERYRYRNEPQEWRLFRWPGNLSQIGARIKAVSDFGNVQGELRENGPWALFHLLSRADISNQGGAEYRTSWSIPASDGSNLQITFRLRADRQDSLFSYRLINRFNLPQSLFGRG